LTASAKPEFQRWLAGPSTADIGSSPTIEKLLQRTLDMWDRPPVRAGSFFVACHSRLPGRRNCMKRRTTVRW